MMLQCPICEKMFDPQQSPAVPFCSRRCKLLDLNRWLEEKYGLPHQAEDEPEVTDEQ